MPELTKVFSENRVELLRKQIETERKEYEVLVDGFKVTHRTSDINKYYDYERALESGSEQLIVQVFDGSSNYRNKFTFLMNTTEILPPKPLNGLGSTADYDQRVTQLLNDRDKDHELARLKEKLEDAHEKLEAAEEQLATLDTELGILREEKAANKFSLNGTNIVELGGALIRSTIFSKAPTSSTAATLAGIIDAVNPQQQQGDVAQEPVTENTFRDHVEQPQYTPEQLEILQTIQQAQATVSPPQLKQLNTILSQLVKQPAQIVQVAELLKIQM